MHGKHDADPPAGWRYPPGHMLHCVPLGSEPGRNWPGLHCWHAALFAAGANLPAPHKAHTVLPLRAAYWPASQPVHACCSVMSVKKPAGHSAQPPELETTWKPGRQSEQTVLPLLEIRPGAQASHGAFRFCTAEYVSFAHSTHVTWPCAD